MQREQFSVNKIAYLKAINQKFETILINVRIGLLNHDTNELSKCLDELVKLYKAEKVWCVLNGEYDSDHMKIHRLLDCVDESMDTITHVSAFVLKEQYFQHEFKYWYLEYYSVSTYYRKRKEALFEFFSKLIEINDKMAV